MHVLLLDEHGTVLWLSHGDELHSPDQLVGRRVWDLVPESEKGEVLTALAEVVFNERTEQRILTSGFAIGHPQYEVTMMHAREAEVVATVRRLFPPGITAREKDILRRIASDEKPHDIAAELRLSIHTVDSYRRHLKEKLGVSGTAGLVKWAVRTGLVAP